MNHDHVGAAISFLMVAITLLSVPVVVQSERGIAPTSCVTTQLVSSRFSGNIALRGSTVYNNSVAIDNKRALSFPAVVAQPKDDNDVALVVDAAQQCGSKFSVKSGGHSAAGYCLNTGGIVLDLSAMRGVELTYHENVGVVAVVQAGATFSDVYAASAPTGWVPVGGGCPQVGVGGFLLGGGWSFLSRSYGLGCDNVLEMRAVLANHSVVNISEAENRDLWWALRGGGGGNYGVVTQFSLKLVRPEPTVLIGELCWPSFDSKIASIFDVWLRAYDAMPRWMSVIPVWLPIGVPDNKRMFCLTVICNAGERKCDEGVAPYLKFKPELDDLARVPFLTWQMDQGNVTGTGNSLYLKSGIIMPGALTADVVNILLSGLSEAPSSRNLVLFNDIGGGAIADVSKTATAFVHRDAQLIIEVKAIWSDERDEIVNVKWVKDLFEHIEPYLSGSYVNYIDAELEGWQTKYYGVNYRRLQEIKAAVDPTDFFSFGQSIRLPGND